MVFAVLPDTCTLSRRGADCPTVRLSEGGTGGGRLIPPSVTNDGVNVIVPATVPVCRRNCCELFGNTACVVPAGIVKLIVRPPVANCTAGSLLNTSELNVSVSV